MCEQEANIRKTDVFEAHVWEKNAKIMEWLKLETIKQLLKTIQKTIQHHFNVL